MNAYFLIELGFITFISAAIGLYFFVNEKHRSYIIFRAVTFASAIWFGFGFIGEIVNLFNPEVIINSFFDNKTWFKASLFFDIGLGIAILQEKRNMRL